MHDSHVFEQFSNHMLDKNIDVNNHNLYLIETYDMENKLVDTKIGMNLVTDHGLQYAYRRPIPTYRTPYLEYGYNETPSYDAAHITNQILPKTSINRITTVMPIQYNTSNHIFSQRCCIGTSTLDYNITDITVNREVNVLGISRDISPSSQDANLLTFAYIYDINGNRSSFIKKPNEKVVISIYLTSCMKSDVITNAYTNDGLYIKMHKLYRIMDYTTASSATLLLAQFTFSNYHTQYVNLTAYNYNPTSGYSDTPYYFNMDRTITNHTKSTTMSLWDKDQQTANSFLLNSGKRDMVTELRFNVIGHYQMSKNVKIPSNESSEELTNDYVWCNDMDNGSLSYSFGQPWNIDSVSFTNLYTAHGTFPCLDFVITDSYMYNWNTHDWDIQDSYTNPSNTNQYCYDLILDPYQFGTDDDMGMSVIPPGSSSAQNVYVHVNRDTNIPIQKFQMVNGSSPVVYATNAYWDPSSYVVIPNYQTEIPSTDGLNQKRYYITTTKDYLRAYYRNTQEHTIIPATNVYTVATPEGYDDSASKKYLELLSSSTNEWIMLYDYLIYPNSQNPNDSNKPYSYQLKGLFPDATVVYGNSATSPVTFTRAIIQMDGTYVSSIRNDQIATQDFIDIQSFVQKGSIYVGVYWYPNGLPSSEIRVQMALYSDANESSFIKYITFGRNITTSNADINVAYAGLVLSESQMENVKYARIYVYDDQNRNVDILDPTKIYKIAISQFNQFTKMIRRRYNTDDRILFLNYNDYQHNGRGESAGMYRYVGQMMLYTVGNDPTIAPTKELITLPFHFTNTHITFKMYSVFDQLGYFVAGYNGEIYMVDMYNSPRVTFVGNGLCMDNGTMPMSIAQNEGLFTYVDVENGHLLHTYNCATRTEVRTFQLPDEFSEVQCLYSFKKYVYVKGIVSDVNAILLCDIQSGTVTRIMDENDVTQIWNSMAYQFDTVSDDTDRYITSRVQCDDFCMLGGIYGRWGELVCQSMIDATNPYATLPNIALHSNGDPLQINRSILSIPTKLIVTEDGKHVLGIESNWKNNNRHMVYDYGMYHDLAQKDGGNGYDPAYIFPTNQDQFNTRTEPSVICYYKNGIMIYTANGLKWTPLEFWLPHKITGTTRTIQTWNNPKLLHTCEMSATITNDLSQL